MAGKSERSPVAVVRELRRKTGRKFSATEKIRIILDGLKGEANATDRWQLLFLQHPDR